MPDKMTDHPSPQEDDLIHKLFVEEYQSMCRTAYFALGDYGMAETAVQETFLVALRFREKLAASEKPVGWLYNALKFAIKHIRRDRSSFLTHTLPLDSVPEQDLITIDYYSVISKDIKESEDMKLLEAFYIQGYSIREVADRLGISVGACKMRIKRAKEHLRKKLE